MSERIDHATHAMVALDDVQLNYDEGENGTTRATIAQVHATLALVEQQRIANLIALAGNGLLPHAAVMSGIESLTHRVPDPNTPGDVARALRPEIAAVLGVDQ